jgi:hypothetical protein
MKIIFLNCENMSPNAKLKTFVSKINGLKGFTWAKSGLIVKEVFKDWKANSTSSSQIKGYFSKSNK